MTREIHVGNIAVGGGAPVSVQSMCNTCTADAKATLRQIRRLAKAGCDIIRVAVPDIPALDALPEITASSPLPVIADIHFDHRLALGAIKAGVHAVRINPGNIGSKRGVRLVAEAAGEAGIPIRVGANSGSLPKGLYASKLKEGLSPSEAMARSLSDAVMFQIALLEKYSFRDIKVSLKSSSVVSTVAAYRYFSKISDLPLHIGVTEAGTPAKGIIKSAVGIGSLLLDGIGDTLRVSLTADPLKEVEAGISILEAVGLRKAKPEIVSCPTCGRTRIDLETMAGKVNSFVASLKRGGYSVDLNKIAVMGCVVNGPGEASDADLGIAGGAGSAVVFRNGKILKTLPESDALEFLLNEIKKKAHRVPTAPPYSVVPRWAQHKGT